MKRTPLVAILIMGLALGLVLAGCTRPEPKPEPPKTPDPSGLGAALWQAAASCGIDPMSSLLKAGANPNIQYGSEGTTPLMEALRSYNNSCPKDTIALLIKAGADVNLKSRAGLSALHYAAARNCVKQNIEAMVYLLQNGANPYTMDKEKRTPVQLSAISGCRKKVMLLADFMAKNPPPPTPPQPGSSQNFGSEKR